MRGIILGLGLVLLLVVAGCSRKGLTSTTTTKVTDSTIVRIVPRFIPVSVPGKTVTVTEYIECDSITNRPKPKEIKASSKGASVTVKIKTDGSATAEGGCDSLSLLVESKDSIIYHLRKEVIKTENTKPVYLTRDIDKYCRVYTGLSILAFVGYILFKINKLTS